MFSGHTPTPTPTHPTPEKKSDKKGLEKFARYWLVKEAPTNQNRADLISRQHDSNTTTLYMYGKSALLIDVKLYKWLVMVRGEIVHFYGNGSSLSRRRHTQEKSNPVVLYLHDSLWRAESFRMKPTIYSANLWPEILPIATWKNMSKRLAFSIEKSFEKRKC